MELDDLVCLMAASLLVRIYTANSDLQYTDIRKALTTAEKIWEARLDMERERREKQ
jgi:hypothetical protein